MYGTALGLASYWSDRGYAVAAVATDADREQLLRKATVFIDGLGWYMASSVLVNRFPGLPTSMDQENAWPRTGATDVYGRALDEDTVPSPVIRATYEAAYYEGLNEGALNEAVRSDQSVVREKIDVIETQYAEPEKSTNGVAASMPVIPAVMAILAPVLTGGSNPHGITGVVA